MLLPSAHSTFLIARFLISSEEPGNLSEPPLKILLKVSVFPSLQFVNKSGILFDTLLYPEIKSAAFPKVSVVFLAWFSFVSFFTGSKISDWVMILNENGSLIVEPLYVPSKYAKCPPFVLSVELVAQSLESFGLYKLWIWEYWDPFKVAVGVTFSNNLPFCGISSRPVALFLNTNPASIKRSPIADVAAFVLLKLNESLSMTPNWVPFKKVFFLKSPFVNESVLIV